ncbi:hypothetical protein O3P69_018804 [Scylla paramamosain]|uniref:Uncharacterized protein n=1 Tax=Scylla paramamosain TaxID=85552 RepID=A0AAW0SSJ4_SCYPA
MPHKPKSGGEGGSSQHRSQGQPSLATCTGVLVSATHHTWASRSPVYISPNSRPPVTTLMRGDNTTPALRVEAAREEVWLPCAALNCSFCRLPSVVDVFCCF